MKTNLFSKVLFISGIVCLLEIVFLTEPQWAGAQLLPALPSNSAENPVEDAGFSNGGSADTPRLRSAENTELPVPMKLHPDSLDDSSGHKPHGTELLGIMPGSTKLSEIKNNPVWAEPIKKDLIEDFLVLSFQLPDIPDMPLIQIIGKNDIVEGIVIYLKDPREEADARISFEEAIKDVRPIIVPNDDGNFREVFPEKGLSFILEKNKENPAVPSTRVIQIVAEQVQADYFVIRAEKDLPYTPALSFADATHALIHDSKNATAYRILAQIEQLRGNLNKAREQALKAAKLNDSVPMIHLTLVSILNEVGEYDSAARYLKAIESVCKEHPLFIATMNLYRGDIYRDGSDEDCDKAITEHKQGLRIVEGIKKKMPPEIRLNVKQLELRLTLSLALDFARKYLDNSSTEEMVFSCLDQASILADNLIKEENLKEIPFIDVCRTAVSVGLDIPNADDVDGYIQSMKKYANLLTDSLEDEILLDSVRWKAGTAFFDALRIYQAREEYQKAINCGLAALEYLEPVLNRNPENGATLLCEISAEIGLLYIESLDDQKEGMRWLGRATALLDSLPDNIKPDKAGDLGFLLVQYSRYYWENDQQDQGLKLAETGTSLLEHAVQEGVVEESEMYVPYTNLAVMYKKMQKTEQAEQYSRKANALAPEQN